MQYDANDFMEFFRKDDFHEKIKDYNCEEIFLNILKGSTDITKDLLLKLCANYGVELESVINN